MKGLNKKGFTLLELLAVLVILAALATIAIPIFTNKGAESRLQSHKANIREISNAIQRFEWDGVSITAADYYTLLDSNNQLITSGYLAAAPASPYAGVTAYEDARYFVGKDPSTGITTVKLVAEDTGATADQLDSTDTAPTDANRTNIVNASNEFLKTGASVEILDTRSATAATGVITIVPANLTDDTDTVTVNGTVCTYNATPGANEFSTAAELEVLIEAIAGLDSTISGNKITITASTAGDAGNDITLATNDATAAVLSGATLSGGADAVAATAEPASTTVR